MGRDYYFYAIYNKKALQEELFGDFGNKVSDYLYWGKDFQEEELDVEVRELLYLSKDASDILRPFWNYGCSIKEECNGEYIVIDKKFIIDYLNDKRMEFDYTNFYHVALLDTLFAILMRFDFDEHTLVFSSC